MPFAGLLTVQPKFVRSISHADRGEHVAGDRFSRPLFEKGNARHGPWFCLQIFYCVCNYSDCAVVKSLKCPAPRAPASRQYGLVDSPDPTSHQFRVALFRVAKTMLAIARSLLIRKPSHRVTFGLPSALSTSQPRRGIVLPTIGKAKPTMSVRVRSQRT
jgi:hypothetical protein